MKNGKRYLKSLVLMTAALIMVLSVPAMAATSAKMTRKGSNKYYDASHKATKDENIYFRLDAPGYGLLDVMGSKTSSSNVKSGVSVTLYRTVNSKFTRIDYYSSVYVNTSNSYARYAISPGTYYFKVSMTKGYTYNLYAQYRLTSGNAGGAAKSSSTTLSRGKAMTGVISAASFKGAKWFRFYVPKQGKPVNLKVQLNGGQGQLIFYVAGPNFKSTQKNLITPSISQAKSRTLTIWQEDAYTKKKTGPKPGWYYVLVTKNSSSSTYKRSNGQFAIKWYY